MTVFFTSGEDLNTCPMKETDEAYVFVDPNNNNLCINKISQPIRITLIPVIGGLNAENLATFMAFYLGKLNEKLDKKIPFHLHNACEDLKPLIHSLTEQGRSCVFNCASVELPPPPQLS